ncbi:MAG TPA: hypothetical protein VFQ40_09255 [Actinomycetota bacterium]|nr:hypothetical protein [Actinomycetota bacterium]
MNRKSWDQIVSGAGAVVAVVLIVLGAMAIYGGNFGRENVRDRLEPQNIEFPPAEAMTPEEKAAIGEFAGEKVDTGPEAEAFSRYIGGHLTAVNEGKTYSETSSEARALEEDDPARAELDAKVQTLFRGETLRAILLNAYGWWTVASLAEWVGWGMVVAGVILAIFAILGFRHAGKVERTVDHSTGDRSYAEASV